MRGGAPELGDETAAAREVTVEWLQCVASPVYFAERYVQIHSGAQEGWIPFALWPAQASTLAQMAVAPRLVVLKARQLGLSWLALAYALWLMTVRAPATILLFSLRAAEARDLLQRLRGMYGRLPRWLQARTVVQDAAMVWELSTGSRALAFSTRAGRSYTGTLALVDEADFIPDLPHFLNGVKPTIDGGGQLLLISTSDKRRPVSAFKNLFRAAQNQTGDYVAIFLPWWANPARDEAWVARTRAEMFAQRGTDDDFLAEYPASAQEALAPEALDRRLPPAWVLGCLDEEAEAIPDAGPALPGLAVYAQPAAGKWYVIGADPAEGNPQRDASAATVLDAVTGAEVAALAGPFEPAIFAELLGTLAHYYNGARVLVERNNHGHAVLLALADRGETELATGFDGKPGWLNTARGKSMLYSHLAEMLRTQSCTICNGETAQQLASIQASDLRAPVGLHDDRAVAFALAVVARVQTRGGEASVAVPPVDPLARVDEAGW